MGSGASILFDLANRHQLSPDEQQQYHTWHKELVVQGKSVEEIHRMFSEKLESKKMHPKSSSGADGGGGSANGVSGKLATPLNRRRRSLNDLRTVGLSVANFNSASPSSAAATQSNAISEKGVRPTTSAASPTGGSAAAQDDFHSSPLPANWGRRSLQINLSTTDKRGFRCELCNINFVDEALLEHHRHSSALHARNIAKKMRGAGEAAAERSFEGDSTARQHQHITYQNAIDMVRFQSDLSRSSQALQVYFTTHEPPKHDPSSHAVVKPTGNTLATASSDSVDKSKLLLRKEMKTHSELPNCNETVLMSLYLVEDRSFTKDFSEGPCDLIEIYVSRSKHGHGHASHHSSVGRPKHTKDLLTRTFLVYQQMVMLCQYDIRHAFDEQQKQQQRASSKAAQELVLSSNPTRGSPTQTLTSGEDILDPAIPKTLILETIISYINDHIHFKGHLEAGLEEDFQAFLVHKQAKIGQKLDTALSTMAQSSLTSDGYPNLTEEELAAKAQREADEARERAEIESARRRKLEKELLHLNSDTNILGEVA